MSRSARLLALLQHLRRRRRPVTAAALAEELGVSVRTVYRDIAALAALGAPVEGEAGLGYVLAEGGFLPPLMFTEDEVEAVALGLGWVGRLGDRALAEAAADALAKVSAVLPEGSRGAAAEPRLLAGPRRAASAADDALPLFRQAIRAERKVRIGYADRRGHPTSRTIWPFALAFFDEAQIVAAWCEVRQDFRHFRLDRIAAAEPTAERYPRRRGALLRAWRATLGADAAPGRTPGS